MGVILFKNRLFKKDVWTYELQLLYADMVCIFAKHTLRHSVDKDTVVYTYEGFHHSKMTNFMWYRVSGIQYEYLMEYNIIPSGVHSNDYHIQHRKETTVGKLVDMYKVCNL